MNKFIRTLASIFAVILCVFETRRASASLFSSISLAQDVSAGYTLNGNNPMIVISPVTDNMSNFHLVAEASSQHGGTISATYDAYDSGGTAGFSIATTASTTSLGNDLIEESLAGNASSSAVYTTFVFDQPVYYLLSIYDTATQNTGAMIGLNPRYPGGGTVNVFEVQPNKPYQFTGTLFSGVPYLLDEDFSLSNQGGNATVPTLSGTESIAFTFTAIPEPLPGTLIVPLALLACARRTRLAVVEDG